MLRKMIRLVVSCVVLGTGVAILLIAALGSDGYSTMVNGISLALDLEFWVVNLAVGVVFVAVAWSRGLTPGIGTIVQPIVVGVTISLMLHVLPEPDTLWIRGVLLGLSFPVVAAGVAGYLAADAGAGPTEAAALAFDPPVPFKWSYSVVQGGGALLGWLCGAAIGPGTILVIFLLGPVVDWLSSHFSILSFDRIED